VRNMQHRWTPLTPIRLFGAEEEVVVAADPQEGAVNDEPADDDDAPVDKFSPEYVATLRKENADRRIAAKKAEDRATALEAQLAKIKLAEMTDLEAAKTELEAAQSALSELQTSTTAANAALKTERIQNAVTMAALEADFEDPTDALSMISQDDLVDDEGNIDGKAVKGALKKLSDRKPYLLKSHRPGSGDGGGKGSTTPDIETHEGRVAAHKQKMIESGGRVVV